MTPTRQMAPCGIYHVYNRGNNGADIYQSDSDCYVFLNLLYKYQNIFDFKIYAICLMNNHYHFLLKDNQLYLPNYMNTIQSQYAQKFNKKYNKKGHLFEGPFRSRLVKGSNDLFLLMKYIVRNPVKAGVTNNIHEYKWNAPALKNPTSRFIEIEFIENTYPLWSDVPFWEFLASEKDDFRIAKIEIHKKTQKQAAAEFDKIIRQLRNDENLSFFDLDCKEKKEAIRIARYNGISITHLCEFTSFSKDIIFRIDYTSIPYL